MARYELNGTPPQVNTYNKYPSLDNRIDSEDEYMLIRDIRQVFFEAPDDYKVYNDIMEYHDYEPDRVALNIKGIIDKSLPFYQKYLQANTVSIIMKTLALKVVDNNFKFIINGQEIMPDNGKFQKLVTEMNKYGTILVNVLPNVDINDFEYETIEPYRFYKDDNETVIFSIVDDYVDKDELVYTSYIKEHRYHKDGVLYITKEQYYITATEGHIKVPYSYRQDSFDTDTDNLFVMSTTDGHSIIESIRNELFMIDLIETAKATEIKATQTTIHLEDRFIECGQVRIADVYRIYESDGGMNKPMFEVVQPNIREKAYENMQTYYFKAIATNIGMSPTQLGFITVEEQTATNALLDDTKSIETANNLRDNFLHEIEEILTVYFPGIQIILPQFYSQSVHLKATVVNQLAQTMSVEQKVAYMYPEWTEEQKSIEVALIKYQNNARLTINEKQILENMGYTEFDNAVNKPLAQSNKNTFQL